MKAGAIEYKFNFDDTDKKGYWKIKHSTVYGPTSPFGYDMNTVPKDNDPYFFSVTLPEGNYKVTVVLGNKKETTNTTIRAESRRLMLENVKTSRGKFVTRSFIVKSRWAYCLIPLFFFFTEVEFVITGFCFYPCDDQ